MSSDTPAGPAPFSIFRSAADEAAVKLKQGKFDNEGRRVRSTATRVVHVAGSALPYHVVVTRKRGEVMHHNFATMREAETFVRRNSAAPAPGLSALYDRPAPKL